MIAALFLLAVADTPLQAPASPFTGSWMMDLDSIDNATQTEAFSLRGGVFSRGEADSVVRVKADAVFHALPKDDYVDAVSVRVLGPRHVRELDRFHGKLVYAVDYRVSANGATMTQQVIDYSKPDHKPIPTRIVHRRVGPLQRGSALLSGRWRATKIATTRAHLTETITLVGSRFSSAGPGGYGFDAEIGGAPAPIRGDAETAQVTVAMPDDHRIVEHLSSHGTEKTQLVMTLLADGRTIKATALRKGDGRRSSWTLHKQ